MVGRLVHQGLFLGGSAFDEIGFYFQFLIGEQADLRVEGAVAGEFDADAMLSGSHNHGMQLAAEFGGVGAALGWPLRYSHSPAEVIDMRDMDALGRIVAVLAKEW